MPWQTRSRRRAELPPNWPAIRTTVLHRDHHTCRIRSPRCTRLATQVDHIGDRHDHTLTNLRATCPACHAWRTSLQGHAAKATRRRPVEAHPGRL